MKIPSIRNVECAVLHDRYGSLDPGALHKFIRDAAADNGLHDECVSLGRSTGNEIQIVVGDLRVRVSQNELPLGSTGFWTTLGFASTQMAFPNAADIVRAHCANTHICVAKAGGDPAPESTAGEQRGAIAHPASITASAEAEAAIRLCALTALHVHQQHAATAFHWFVNNQLFRPQSLETFVEDDDLLPLFVRPHVTTNDGRLIAGEPLGVHGVGAQFMVGRMVRFEEERVPFGWMTERLSLFIRLCRERDALLPDGETFGADASEVISVRHEDASREYYLPQVVLKVMRCRAHGIDYLAPRQTSFRFGGDGDTERTDPFGALVDTFRSVVESGDLEQYAPIPLERERPNERLSVDRLRAIARRNGTNGFAGRGGDPQGDIAIPRKASPFRR